MIMRFACLFIFLLFGGSVKALSMDTVVIVVRHAEKAVDDPRDPGLSEAGLRRANALAKALSGSDVNAVFASQFKRTQLTAQPTAVMQRTNVQVIAAEATNTATHGDELKQRLLRDHAGQSVLIVGHSNTVPAIITALSGQHSEPMPDTEYDRFTVVILPAQGPARVLVSRY